MRSRHLLVSLGLLLVTTTTQATGIGIRGGSTGVGAGVAFKIVPTFSARFGYSYFNYDTSVTDTDVHYDATLKMSNFNAFLDWSPVGPFRLTAGLMPNNNKISITGRPNGSSYTINGTTYAASDIGSLSGSIKPGNRMSPYLGIGYGNVSGTGVNFYFDAGVMYQGSPKASVNVTCGAALSTMQCNTLRNDVAAEQQDLENDLRKARWYPVVNLGITIGF